MRVKSRLFRLPVRLAVVFTGLFISHLVYAQVDTGTVEGTVRNPAGEGAVSATVTLKSAATLIERSTHTRTDGTYILTAVQPGTYILTAKLKAFAPATQTGLVVNIRQNVVADFALEPAKAEAEGEAGAAQVSSSAQPPHPEENVSEELTALPLYRRNYIFLAQLLPGVVWVQQTRNGLETNGNFVANGVRPSQNNYQLDGVDNNSHLVDFLTSTAYVNLPPPEAIQEFSLLSPNYSAALGGTAGPVLSAVIKSGTSQYHGTLWEFFGNDRLNAADFFDNAGGAGRAQLRKNQFGIAVGGPVAIPRFFKGNNKTFFFADYQGTRIHEGVPETTTVPSAAERGSGFTNFSDLITAQPGCTRGPDLLGRTVNCGTIFDPATTRLVLAGGIDPVTGNTATGTGYVRDPFAGNTIPIGVTSRIDPVAVGILGLYPAATTSGIFNNYTTNKSRKENGNTFDVRLDQAFTSRDQAFARFSYQDAPVVQAGPFAGFGDGGGYTQASKAQNAVLSETHVFSSTFVNEFRLGYSGINADRVQPFANDLSNIPGQFGIPAVPQVAGNGGLSTLNIGILTPLGSSPFLFANDYESSIQISDSVSRVYGSHTLQAGGDARRIKAATFQPAYSRGQFNFNGSFTSIPNMLDPSTGIAQLLLAPTTASTTNGVNFVGGPNQVMASNISNIDNRRSYLGAFVEDHWKYSSRITADLGVRWEYFEPQKEYFSAEANFIPGAPGNGAQYLIPVKRTSDVLSSSFSNLLAADRIAGAYTSRGKLIQTTKYARTNFAPRVGIAYEVTSKLVIRAGAGIYYDGLENQGVLANLGGNYPFQLNYNFRSPNDVSPLIFPYSNTNATIEQGLVGITLNTSNINASQLMLRGIQQTYKTPYTEGVDFSAGYQLTSNSKVELAYTASMGRHLPVNARLNEPSIILRPGEIPQSFLPFPDFAYGSSYIVNGGSSYSKSYQVTYIQRLSHGLSFLGDYAYSKAYTDAHDLIFSAGDQPYRAPHILGFGFQRDYGLANFDVRHAIHLSGEYDLPLGKGKPLFADGGSILGKVLGGWSMHWIATLQSGQPVTVPCSIMTSAVAGCYALGASGSGSGGHGASQFWNASAFSNPAVVTFTGQPGGTPLGGAPSQAVGPGYRRLDLALHKNMTTSDRTHLEFRVEAYNVTNHANFALPTVLDFSNPAYFGQSNATRDNPNSPRQIQLALRFYF